MTCNNDREERRAGDAPVHADAPGQGTAMGRGGRMRERQNLVLIPIFHIQED